MPAYKQINRIIAFQAFLEPGDEPWVVPARVAAYMRHKHIYLFYAETIKLR